MISEYEVDSPIKPTIYNYILPCRNVHLFMYQRKKVTILLTAGSSKEFKIAQRVRQYLDTFMYMDFLATFKIKCPYPTCLC